MHDKGLKTTSVAFPASKVSPEHRCDMFAAADKTQDLISAGLQNRPGARDALPVNCVKQTARVDSCWSLLISTVLQCAQCGRMKRELTFLPFLRSSEIIHGVSGRKETQVREDATETNRTIKWVGSPGRAQNGWWWWHNWAAIWQPAPNLYYFLGCECSEQKNADPYQSAQAISSKIKVIKLVIRHPGSLCVCVYTSVSSGMSICGRLCVVLCVWQVFHWCVIITKGLVVLGPTKQSDTLQFPKETQIPITRMSFCYTSSKQNTNKRFDEHRKKNPAL